MMWKNIRITEETKNKLDKIKNDLSYNKVILGLLGRLNTKDMLNKQTEQIQNMLNQVIEALSK